MKSDFARPSDGEQFLVSVLWGYKNVWSDRLVDRNGVELGPGR